MSLQIGSTAPDFEAQTTEGPIRFHDWAGYSWAVPVPHPRNFTPRLHDRAGLHGQGQARVRSAQREDHRAARRSTPSATTRSGRRTSRRRKAPALNYPLIGDAEFTVAKLYGMLLADASAATPTSARRR